MNATAFRVRRLARADIPVMLEMSAMFADAFDEPDTYAHSPSGGYLERLLGNDQFVALAATQAGAVVGGLIAYELVKYERERSEFYIYDLAVREDFRRRGVATAMIAEVRRIAAANAAEVVFVQADYGDDPAITLYSKLGRREDVMHFDIPAAGAGT